MKNFHITETDFLNWYFDDGQDQEIESLKEGLAALVINKLYKTGKAVVSVKNLFDEANKEAIKICYLQEYKANETIEFISLDGETELQDAITDEEFFVKLIKDPISEVATLQQVKILQTENYIRLGDYFYLNNDRGRFLRKVTFLSEAVFEWSNGWANIAQLRYNEDAKSYVKFEIFV